MNINTICDRAILLTLADRSYIIPEFGEESEVLMQGSNDFISDISGCDYSYQIVMADNTAVPDHYTIDQYDGSITFDNRASKSVDEYIGIVISAVDDYSNQHQYQTSYFRVTSECGVSSTTVIAPTDDQI